MKGPKRFAPPEEKLTKNYGDGRLYVSNVQAQAHKTTQRRLKKLGKSANAKKQKDPDSWWHK